MTTEPPPLPAPVVRFLDAAADLPALVRVERRSGVEDELWGPDEFCAWHTTPRQKVFVVECCGHVVGYLAAKFHSRGKAAVAALTVLPEYRRQRLGTLLFTTLRDLPLRNPVAEVVACARESDLVAQLFLKSLGFTCLGIDTDFYDAPPEPAYFFQWLRQKDKHESHD